MQDVGLNPLDLRVSIDESRVVKILGVLLSQIKLSLRPRPPFTATDCRLGNRTTA